MREKRDGAREEGGKETPARRPLFFSFSTSTRRMLACSRLQDSGEKSFSKKKCEKCAGAGERRHRPVSQVARVLFSLCSF